ncbi:MAG: heavy-metal-associated domain-containing protein [Chloroflexi bacterium]|nr:heavy-metal-associated domain-containing protein [Chloroflexota bacterium]
MNKTYSVPSIHCQHCVYTIKMELSELEGVQNVEADLDSKKVSITFDNPELEKTILETLDEIGYPVES